MRSNFYGNNGIKVPCVKECPNRKAGCHATCELYKKYVEEKAKVKAEVTKQKVNEYNLTGQTIAGIKNFKTKRANKVY